jgi:hypothetical protein
MKFLFAILVISALQACTSIQMTPEERESARERRAEMHAMFPDLGRSR